MWIQTQDGSGLIYCSGFLLIEARDCFELNGIQVGSTDGICLGIYSDPIEAMEEIEKITQAIENGVNVYRFDNDEF